MNDNLSPRSVQTTGRYLVLMQEGEEAAGMAALREMVGTGEIDDSAMSHIGVAVVSLDPNQLQSVRVAVADDSQPIVAMEAEQIMYAIGDNSIDVDTANYLRGYKDGVNHLVDGLIGGKVPTEQQITISAFANGAATWGLQATKVTNSAYSGAGIKIAVLDTGLDLAHPDFAGRNITTKSFIPGEDVQDLQGHGTHCIGTACGALTPPDLSFPMRYGIAYDAEIFVGKVLSNQGSSVSASVTNGMNWAISQGCQIISMSLGGFVQPGGTYSTLYEVIAQRALRQGTIIIAAAGNDSERRLGSIAPVSSPANCPSIMAVAALDNRLQIADFSNGSINPQGGQIDIAAPGVSVYSTWSTDPMTVKPPGPSRYRTISGTSMATPHVAGIAALHAEATGKRGVELWTVLIQRARRSPLPSVDVGNGLVQAP
jgi:subtilisin